MKPRRQSNILQTYQGGISRSHIDITFVKGSEQRWIRDWEVLDDYTGSLHKYFVYIFSSVRHIEPHPTETRWSWRKYDKEKLIQYINSNNVREETEPVAAYTALDRYLVGVCDSCMPKGQYKKGKKPVYWWNREIEDLRNDFKKARRRSKIMRHKSTEEQEQCRSDFNNALRKAIGNSKEPKNPVGGNCASKSRKTPGVSHINWSRRN